MEDILSAQIQAILGWKPDAADSGQVEDLNSFPTFLIDTARRLPSMLCYAFLRHYTSPDNLEFLPVFIEDVIIKNIDVTHWHLGRVIVPDFSTNSLVQIETEDIISPLLPIVSETWFQIKPRFDYWEAGEYLTGAPAIIRPNLNYRYFPPTHVRDLLIPGPELSQIFDLKVSVRRWIASNIAGVAKRQNLLDIKEPKELLHKCFPSVSQISKDGFIAAHALIQELTTISDKESEVPGFRGPEEWYKDEVKKD